MPAQKWMNQMVNEVAEVKPPVFVIACGDEGVQLNEGVRLGVVGSGIRFEHAPKIIAALKKTFPLEQLRVVASQENDWIRAQFDLATFEQADATMQQQAEVLADKEELLYGGFLPFADPKNLQHGVRGHMVRPRKIHIANAICFTVGGGEQVYNLGRYMISADWLHAADFSVAKAAIEEQVAFYTKLGTGELKIVIIEEGQLDDAVKAKNKATLKKLGYGE